MLGMALVQGANKTPERGITGMAQRLAALVAVFLFVWVLVVEYGPKDSSEAFPNRPITIVVHSKPGSGVDLMARSVADIARDFCPQPLVIENRPGTQGTVAMQHVLDNPPDGYTVLAVTRSFLSTVLVGKSHVQMTDFNFLAAMLTDPEALLVHRNAAINDFPKLLADLRNTQSTPENLQVWIGPGTGSRDHLMALKTWQTMGLQGKWIDYKTGPQAVLGLLRQEAPVYIGNPSDLRGRPDLKLAVVASAKRMPQFPDVPTFQEFGFPLDESMWRGFAVHHSATSPAVDYLTDLLKKVSQDPRWKGFCNEVYALPVFESGPAINARVKLETKETSSQLLEAGLLRDYAQSGSQAMPMLALAGILFVPPVLVSWRRKKYWPRNIWPALGLIWLALWFWWQTTRFIIPEAIAGTSPALMPRIWSGLLLVTATTWLVKSILHAKSPDTPGPAPHLSLERDGLHRVGLVILSLVVFYLTLGWIGYFVGTFFLIMTNMWIIGYRRWFGMIAGAAGFVVFSWAVFGTLLRIQLPPGSWLT